MHTDKPMYQLVNLGKLYLALSALFAGDKDATSHITDCRAKLETLAAQLAYVKPKDPLKSELVMEINSLHSRTLEACKQIIPQKLFLALDPDHSPKITDVFTFCTPGSRLSRGTRIAVSEWLYNLPRFSLSYEANLELGLPMAKRGEYIHLFVSLVRNLGFLGILNTLGVEVKEASALATQLSRVVGSAKGKELMIERWGKINSLPPGSLYIAPTRPKEILDIPADAYQLTVQLKISLIHDHPIIAELLMKLPMNRQVQELLVHAGRLIILDSDVADSNSVQKIVRTELETLISGLKAQEKVLAKEKTKRNAEILSQKREKAVDALRGLPPDLLDILKNNPQLLTKV